MGSVKSHKDLVVWQKSMALAVMIYDIVKLMPRNEQYGMTSQMQRAACSIPSNIAEGNARGTRKDYARFVGIAFGSLAELETQLDLIVRVGLLSSTTTAPAESLVREVGRMLTSLRSRLSEPLDSDRNHISDPDLLSP